MTTTSHIRHTRHVGRGTILFLLAILATGISLTAALPLGSARAGRATGSYGWPVKPFDRQHPVRGNFGDPRTVFTGPPTFRSLMSGGGTFSFHFGVDVFAPDGTAVYSVRSGTATLHNSEAVHVSSGDGFATEYWHIVPTVRNGQSVVAYETIIGRVKKGAHHVHFTEFENGAAVNPLAPGHLTPYSDRTTPHVSSITFRKTAAGRDIAPEFLSGRIHMIVDAEDEPTMPVPSPTYWRGMPVTPALVQWRLVRVADGKVMVPRRSAFDVRRRLPSSPDFWKIYARGSHQNMIQFTTRHYGNQPGKYLFRLTRTAFDTHRVRNGVYTLIVEVSDTRGHRSSSSQVLTISN